MYEGLKNLEVPRKRHPGARRAFRVGLIGLVLFAVFVGATGIFVYKKVSDAFRRAQDETILTDEQLPNQPINVLVVGSDRRDIVDPGERRRAEFRNVGGGQRADTIILIHISAKAHRAVAMHFPRDLRVQIPGRSGFGKINAAYGGSDPQNRMIQTVKQFSGLPIHHYVEINFNSFRAIVNGVGGVRICVTRGYNDRRSGLRLPRAGCYTLMGDMALAFVRARYIDPRADLGRIERQQMFMRALMDRVESVKFLLNPGRVSKVADAVGDNFKFSKEVDLTLARAIAQKLSGDQKRVDFRVVPNVPRYIGGQSYVIARDAQTRAMFDAMKDDRRLPPYGRTGASIPRRREISITVRNGTGVEGVARAESKRLRALGYRIHDVVSAETIERTRILVEPGAELKAKLVHEEYPYAYVGVSTREFRGDLVLTLGKDFLKARASPSPS